MPEHAFASLRGWLADCFGAAAGDAGIWRAMVMNAPDFIMVLQRDGTILFLNRGVPGYPVESVIGRPIYEFVPATHHGVIVESVESVFDTGDPLEIEVEAPGADGGLARYSTRVGPLRCEDEVGAVVLSARDVTEQRRAERQVREVDRRMEALILASPAPIVAADCEGRVLEWNPAAERVFGWRKEEVLGQPLPNVPPEGELRYRALLDRVLAGERVEAVEVRRQRRDGTPVDVVWSLAPLRDADDSVAGSLAVGLDLTERRRGEESRRRLEAAMEQAAEGVFITDLEGRIEYVNPAFTRITGYAREEALGADVRLLNSGEHGPELYRELWTSLLAGEVWSGTLTNRRKDGTHYREVQTIAPVRDGEGRITEFVAIQRDVTEEEAVQEQLRQAQKMEAIGQLAGGVAHDFNNLLTAILGGCSLLEDALAANAAAIAELREIRRSADRATALTRQLLAFSRRQVLRPRLLDLNGVVVGVEKMLRRVIGEDVVLDRDLDAELGTVRADPGQIEQVIMNLAVNARDAMPQGGTLTIRTRNAGRPRGHGAEAAGPGRYAVLSVGDTGSGMDAATKARIFEPFFTTKEQGKGTGLGLSTVYGIVTQSDGHIDVSSSPGRGTIFDVYLPVVDAPAEADADSNALSADGGDETLLLVEDDPAVARVTARMLKRHGYTVLSASSGEAALALAGEHGPVDLLLTDVILPDTSGPELGERLLAEGLVRTCLYMSGYAGESVVRRGLEGGLPWVQKPFGRDELAARVREALDAASE